MIRSSRACAQSTACGERAHACALQRDLSLSEDGPEQRVWMAYLAVVGPHGINVPALHPELLETELFRDFSEIWPSASTPRPTG